MAEKMDSCIRAIDTLDDDFLPSQLFTPPAPPQVKRKACPPVQKKFNINFEDTPKVPEFSINVGGGIVMEISNKFKGSQYVSCFRSYEDGEIKSRININTNQFDTFTRACQAMNDHIAKSNRKN